MTTTSQSTASQTAEAFADKVFKAALGTMETFNLYLGDRLGWFDALAEAPATAAELAEWTNTQPRYAIEWLEMMAVYGNLIVVDEGAGNRLRRRYALPPGAAEALTNRHSLNYQGALPQMLAAVGRQLDRLLQAYRHGGGVSWAELGDDARDSQAALNRPWFESALAPALAAMPQIDSVLRTSGARIADIGCGGGWSTIALARAYPSASVIGVDVDEPSIQAAQANAEEAGVADRASFTMAEGVALGDLGPFDAAFAFECVHDMPRPVAVLAAIHDAVRPDGLVVIMDEAVADNFTAPGDPVEQVMYGYSTLICLPDGLSSTPSEGTGTVMRRSVLTDYAIRAGFTSVEVLPIEDFAFFRFYRLLN
ncbi:MAG TPA: class I SAM-dependent methyltransferase [Propionibacteriaceae bacterium]|nr:class I SAM-dependent methyltransferase [Propionibacteriaceae bacterium]